MKDTKHYKYIPELIAAIFEDRKKSVDTLKRTICLQDHHPVNIQSTIAHTQPGARTTSTSTQQWRTQLVHVLLYAYTRQE